MAAGNLGECALCSQIKLLTFEHLPPKSAFNNKPIYIQGIKDLLKSEGEIYGLKKRSPKGFGGFTLCASCNNNTGNWYAQDYAEFAKQGVKILQSMTKAEFIISGQYQIRPLNVLKQIIAMFLSADKSGHLRADKDLVNFVLKKYTIELPRKYKVFAYSSMSKYRRFIGSSVVHDNKFGVLQLSEINFEPFGFVLAENCEKYHDFMCDISSFGNFEYNKLVNLTMKTAYLEVRTPWIGQYY